MRKSFLIILFSLLTGIAGVNAQVTIGADEAPHSGAVLDLRSDTTIGKGLKLPVVEIKDASKFQLSAADSTAEGMMVYNINPSIIGGEGKGLYVWNGSVWEPVTPFAGVRGIRLDTTSLTFTTPPPYALKAIIIPSKVEDKSIIWNSSKENVASVSPNGVVTPLSDGATTITATTVDGNKTATCAVTVAIAVTDVTLDKHSLLFPDYKAQKLTATVNPSIVKNKAVTWKTSNENVATVSTDGTVTPVFDGKATITVTTVDGNKTDSCEITVNTMVFVEGRDTTLNGKKIKIHDFYIGKFEVSQKQYFTVMGKWPTSVPNGNYGKSDQHPIYDVGYNAELVGTGKAHYTVNGVTYREDGFCSKLSKRFGDTIRFRLPTEVEWEYAARGGKKTKGYTYSGGNGVDSVAWHSGNSGNVTKPVGTKAPNELGLYDMSGNVYEWCSDWYSGTFPYSAGDNPTGPTSGSERVLRGGSAWSDSNSAKVSTRGNKHTPDTGGVQYGFRVVMFFNPTQP